MKRTALVLMLTMLTTLLTVSVFSAPVAGTVWGTVNIRAELITDLSTLMSTNNCNGANGLSVALQRQAVKAQTDINELYALDTTQLTDEEMAQYTEALTKLNVALTNASTICTQLSYSDTANVLGTTYSGLTILAQHQVDNDTRFCQSLIQPNSFAPVGGTTWGTVNFKC
jgi:hypothetical protein